LIIEIDEILHWARNDHAPNCRALIRREFLLNSCGTRGQWPILQLHSEQVLCGACTGASSCRRRLN